MNKIKKSIIWTCSDTLRKKTEPIKTYLMFCIVLLFLHIFKRYLFIYCNKIKRILHVLQPLTWGVDCLGKGVKRKEIQEAPSHKKANDIRTYEKTFLGPTFLRVHFATQMTRMRRVLRRCNCWRTSGYTRIVPKNEYRLKSFKLDWVLGRFKALKVGPARFLRKAGSWQIKLVRIKEQKKKAFGESENMYSIGESGIIKTKKGMQNLLLWYAMSFLAPMRYVNVRLFLSFWHFLSSTMIWKNEKPRFFKRVKRNQWQKLKWKTFM